MTDTNLPTNVTPLRPKDPTAALRARRARRKRKTMTQTMTGTVTAVPIAPSENLNEIKSTVTVAGNASNRDGMSGVDIGRSVAIRDAARSAASVAAPDSRYVARLLTLEEPATRQRIEVSPPRPARHTWSALGRAAIGLAIVGTGAWVAITSMRGNAWFGHSLTPDPAAGEIYATLSVAAEVLACLIPTGIRFYSASGERWTALCGRALMAVALTVVFFAAGGFAITNINSGIEARAERQTAEVMLAQRRLDTLAKSRVDECRRRGPECRRLEREEQEAIAALSQAQAGVRAEADPQAAALGISATSLHLVQAGAMVALCLFSGLFISFGAGLIWPRLKEPDGTPAA